MLNFAGGGECFLKKSDVNVFSLMFCFGGEGGGESQ